MAIKTVSPYKLGGALGCTIASGCLTAVLVAVVIQNFATIYNGSFEAKAGFFFALAILQLFNYVTSPSH